MCAEEDACIPFEASSSTAGRAPQEFIRSGSRIGSKNTCNNTHAKWHQNEDENLAEAGQLLMTRSDGRSALSAQSSLSAECVHSRSNAAALLHELLCPPAIRIDFQSIPDCGALFPTRLHCAGVRLPLLPVKPRVVGKDHLVTCHVLRQEISYWRLISIL